VTDRTDLQIGIVVHSHGQVIGDCLNQTGLVAGEAQAAGGEASRVTDVGAIIDLFQQSIGIGGVEMLIMEAVGILGRDSQVVIIDILNVHQAAATAVALVVLNALRRRAHRGRRSTAAEGVVEQFAPAEVVEGLVRQAVVVGKGLDPVAAVDILLLDDGRAPDIAPAGDEVAVAVAVMEVVALDLGDAVAIVVGEIDLSLGRGFFRQFAEVIVIVCDLLSPFVGELAQAAGDVILLGDRSPARIGHA